MSLGIKQFYSLISYPGREIFRKLCKKCAEMRWFFQKFSKKTLHNNALKWVEMRWNCARNVLKCADFSIYSAQKPYVIIRWNVLKCAETLQALNFQHISYNVPAHFSALLGKVFALNFREISAIFTKIQRNSAHFSTLLGKVFSAEWKKKQQIIR